MHRPKVSSIFAAVALAAAAVVPVLFAAPASAADSCDAGQFPASFGAQSSLKVTCHTDAGTNSNHIEIHEPVNVDYHHGAARNVTLDPASGNATTAGSTTIHFQAGAIQTRDTRRPINAFTAAGAAIFKGGTFITSVLPAACTGGACTSATISQGAASTQLTATSKIEFTTNRSLLDAVCTAGTSTLSSASGKFVAADIGKSVSGTPFAAGTFITSVTATVATMNQPHSEACVANRVTTIGGTKFVSGSPVLFNGDPMNINLSNTTSGGQGLTCTAGSHTLAMTAGSFADTGGFPATAAGIAVTIKGATTVATTATAVVTTGNTSLTLAGTCPTGITATAGSASVGVAGATAPKNGDPMMSLAAVLNLNPALVATQDACDLNTFEGFEVIGGWTAPGAYTANAFTPRVTTSQVIFPTSVISFNGFIVPKKGGDTSVAGPHYNFSFPLLPTGLAVCGGPGAPTNPIQLAFGIAATTKTVAPFVPTGSGNPSDPPLRQLQPVTGAFSQKMELILNPSTVVASSTGTACTIGAPTAAPNLACGDG